MKAQAAPDFAATVAQTQHAVAALLGGNPDPEKQLWSRRDDVTLANPAGGYRQGWPAVQAGLELAARGFAGGRSCTFDVITAQAGTGLAYLFEMERYESDLPEEQGLTTGALRVVMIFRLEHNEWKMVHRQADTLAEPLPQEHANESGVERNT